MDPLAAQARAEHRAAQQADELAGRHRAVRDRLVRRLRADDPARWTYTALAAAVECSPELIAHIIRTSRTSR